MTFTKVTQGRDEQSLNKWGNEGLNHYLHVTKLAWVVPGQWFSSSWCWPWWQFLILWRTPTIKSFHRFVVTVMLCHCYELSCKYLICMISGMWQLWKGLWPLWRVMIHRLRTSAPETVRQRSRPMEPSLWFKFSLYPVKKTLCLMSCRI